MGVFKKLTRKQINSIKSKISKLKDKMKAELRKKPLKKPYSWSPDNWYELEDNFIEESFDDLRLDDFSMCCGATILCDYPQHTEANTPKGIEKEISLLNLRLELNDRLLIMSPMIFSILTEAQNNLYGQVLLDSGATLLASEKGTHGYNIHSYLWTKPRAKKRKPAKRSFK